MIRWATQHGAECMRMGDELGAVAVGKLVDLVVVHGDPSRNIGVLGTPRTSAAS